MIAFVLAYALFLTAHAIPAAPALRGRLIDSVGRRAYLAGYSLLSVGLLLWLIASARAAPLIALWPSSPTLALIPIVVMPIACVLFVGGLLAPNPLSISLGLQRIDSDRPGFIAVTRHPILWGLCLWAGSHVAPNGDVVSVALFGGLALYAFAGMWLTDRRARARLGHRTWSELAAKTSMWPFGAQFAGRSRLSNPGTLLPGLTLGLLLYAILLFRLHGWLFGVSPLDAL